MLANSLAALALVASAAAPQQATIYVFDFAEGDRAERARTAAQVIADAEDVVDAVVIYCAADPGARGYDFRRETRSLLIEAGAGAHRIHDAGACSPDLTGRSNDDIGENRVWLALTTIPVLECYRQQGECY